VRRVAWCFVDFYRDVPATHMSPRQPIAVIARATFQMGPAVV